MKRTLTLSQLTALIPECQLHSLSDPAVMRVDYDSRQVEPGSLFVAISGYQTDGHQFLAEAFSRGATAAVVRSIPEALQHHPFLLVLDTRRALALFAGILAGHPDRDLSLVGITGTNGKTTTAFLVAEILDRACGPAGLITTVGSRVAGRWQKAKHTTPEAPDVYRLLTEMKKAGCWSAALEVSSHALELQRIYGMKFAIVVFTNLSQDHLDFHGDFESYFRAKARLFQDYACEAAVINLDDAYGQRLVELTKSPIVTYSLLAKANVRVETLRLTARGIWLRAQTPRGALEVHSPLIGEFNAYNLLCALAVVEALGITHDAYLEAAAEFRGAPGRMERFDWGKRQIYVDYAHTPDALKKVLSELQAIVRGPVHVLFGCGGNRDRGKRPLMGQIAEKHADKVYLTSDNPRQEEPGQIIKEIAAGLAEPRKVIQIEDRREAIHTALDQLPAKGVLLIAGKGHEDYQEIRGARYPFDDREEVRRYLAEHTG